MINPMDDNSTSSIESLREKIRLNNETIRALKDELTETGSHQGGGISRATYVKMIFDATKKIKGQNKELGKVIIETRKMQKDIGTLSGRLDRSFALVENIILRDARNGKWCGECHHLLRAVHENCDLLIRAVEDTGEITREIRQLEDQIGRIEVHRVHENG